MKEPDPDLKAAADDGAGAPDFDALTPPADLVRGERTRDDFFDAVLQLYEPATVDEVADLADHGSDAAREYLDWFERIGIVKQVDDSPATYQLNRDYLTWRRVQQLRDEYHPEELVEYLEAAAERDREFAAQFGVETPDQVGLTDYALTADLSIEEVWKQLSAWRTTRRRIALLERALSTEDTSHSGRQRPVP